MEKLNQYIRESLGQNIHTRPFTDKEKSVLPYYITTLYNLYHAKFLGHELVLIELRSTMEGIQQIDTNIQMLNEKLGKGIVLVSEQIHPFQRKRLIEKGINFIIPGIHLYLPALLIDLKEIYAKPRKLKSNLVPSAQCLLLYYILNSTNDLDNLSLKRIAGKFNYTSMAISKAVDNLQQFQLCELLGTKEKHIHFIGNRSDLWEKALPFMVNPVLKRVYTDIKPEKAKLKAYTTALPEYSNMNPSKQNYFAIDRGSFLELEKRKQIKNLNNFEGIICIEVWKYNPVVLKENFIELNDAVDPLSLYLSLKNDNDERTQEALEKIIEKYIW